MQMYVFVVISATWGFLNEASNWPILSLPRVQCEIPRAEDWPPFWHLIRNLPSPRKVCWKASLCQRSAPLPQTSLSTSTYIWHLHHQATTIHTVTTCKLNPAKKRKCSINTCESRAQFAPLDVSKRESTSGKNKQLCPQLPNTQLHILFKL